MSPIQVIGPGVSYQGIALARTCKCTHALFLEPDPPPDDGERLAQEETEFPKKVSPYWSTVTTFTTQIRQFPAAALVNLVFHYILFI
jgi:hypothetical protein